MKSRYIIVLCTVTLVLAANLYSQTEAKSDWKTFEDPKLGVKFSYPESAEASTEIGFFDPKSFTVWVKSGTRKAETKLWWEYSIQKQPGECSPNFSKPKAGDIPADIPASRTINKAVFALSVDTTDINGFGDDYTSLGIEYHGALLGNCWVAQYSENKLVKAPKPDPKVITAMRADFLRWLDSIDIQANLHPKPETEWKTFEDPKLGVKFSYPGSRVVSAETGFSDPSLLTVRVKLNDTPAAGTNLWSEFYLKKNPAEDCSKYFEKANPADIPVGISKTKTIDGVVFQLAVHTIDVTGFGNDYSSVDLQYYGVLGRNCWVADYSENNLKGAPKPDPKVITAMRADFLRWLDSIDIQAVK